ncbi:hypothetical protein [Mycoplasmoides alvi]|uniref:hypothetical protein n=1 Tax=Mycoplasmoides alvi TaxID=78580 RepID=UPI00051C5CFE|nr:hypothetical protein [Mycoplasmoides alvi]
MQNFLDKKENNVIIINQKLKWFWSMANAIIAINVFMFVFFLIWLSTLVSYFTTPSYDYHTGRYYYNNDLLYVWLTFLSLWGILGTVIFVISIVLTTSLYSELSKFIFKEKQSIFFILIFFGIIFGIVGFIGAIMINSYLKNNRSKIVEELKKNYDASNNSLPMTHNQVINTKKYDNVVCKKCNLIFKVDEMHSVLVDVDQNNVIYLCNKCIKDKY